MVDPSSRALLRRDFDTIVNLESLELEQRELLIKYGCWMEALASGQLSPTTEAQERFVRVARGEAEPSTKYELAWTRFVALKAQDIRRRELRVRELMTERKLSRRQLEFLLQQPHEFQFSDTELRQLHAQLDDAIQAERQGWDGAIVYSNTDGQ